MEWKNLGPVKKKGCKKLGEMKSSAPSMKGPDLASGVKKKVIKDWGNLEG